MASATVYIILFRGIGGATQLPTKPLREALSAAGFEKVATYINSGNAVVRSTLGRAAVIDRIAAICRAEFDFTKAIYAPTRQEWRAVIDRNPFPEALEAPRFLHAALLETAPDAAKVAALQAVAGEREGFAVVGKVAYIHTPDGFGTSKLAERFDRTIGVPNTARNWNTVLKLMALAEDAAS